MEYKPLGSMVNRKIGYGIVQPGQSVPDGVPVIKVNNLISGLKSPSELDTTARENEAKYSRTRLHGGELIVSVVGTIGKTAIVPKSFAGCNLVRATALIDIEDELMSKWVKYYFDSPCGQSYIEQNLNTTVQPTLNIKSLVEMPIPIRDTTEMEKNVLLLSALDEKIEVNRQINDNLEQQAMALYRQMFVENNNDARRECRADEYFDISIGKTPPRKEAQWFSMNPTDCIWVSISDMGRCGMYIADSSEYLTHESVDKFNIKVVPDNTVLLSFKLTVGRVAITDGAMVTNEAIAHFKTDKPEINEYLYCYLKDFNYQTMGSTSSIATAVNSKIIKAMPFVIPTDAELVSFHSVTAPMFEMIKTRQRENTRLAELRDSLLPKLMSGEIDVSDIQL